MRASLTVASITAAFLAGCTSETRTDPGPATSRTMELSDFRKIALTGTYDVEVRTGGQPGVRVEGPAQAIERLVVEVKGDVLQIHPKKGNSFNWSNSPKIRIAVTVPALEGATIAGSSKLEIDRIAGQSFNGSIAGSSNLEIDELAVRNLELSIAGSGDVDVAGRAERASFNIAGSGSLDAGKLQSRDVTLSVAGSGDVEANASGTVKGEIVGSGSAKISGGAKCEVRKLGSGSIDCS